MRMDVVRSEWEKKESPPPLEDDEELLLEEDTDENANEEKMPKNEIAMISSIEDEAKMKDGIPLSIPNPFSCKSNKDGTTTAGLTAPKINPIYISYIQI